MFRHSENQKLVTNNVALYQVVLVDASPDSGKSSQIPRLLHAASHGHVVCSQTYRLMAVLVASHAAADMRVQLGHEWNFRIGFTPKEGLVIHSVAYVDGNRGRRPIARRLSFVEIVVPYGDPNEPHYRKNAFDAGEDGLGKNANSLKKGCDCLGHIKYFDAHLSNFTTGGVETIENVVCLHEKDHGILWKHQDWRTGLAEVRRSRRLTVSFMCTIANYEYGFYWHFYQDGKIEAEVKLTGILSILMDSSTAHLPSMCLLDLEAESPKDIQAELIAKL
ncbi:hypothetical protein E2562_036305 [Oryza meyeriana var. granulata]|uniref:Amine oxidase n=1 Tax=Oryza meyeriana var. granulata TaxID=110450 RepID=A0A6G1FG29_9ORYZ|nr:hypothetical protein E2562_036305 [Oryza meyeriana var. granulata]